MHLPKEVTLKEQSACLQPINRFTKSTSCIWICNTLHYLILASSTEGLRSGVSFLFLGLPVEVFDGDCAADITEGREAVVGGRPEAAHALDCCTRFAARISWEDSDNWNAERGMKYRLLLMFIIKALGSGIPGFPA